jgi:hypothetical protein
MINNQIKDFSLERIYDYKNIIQLLDKKNINCVFRKYINRKMKEYLLIYFSSKTENLTSLGRISRFKGNFLIFCDRSNTYYEYINNIIEYCKKHINTINPKNIVIMGQSMGGYAALYLSTFISNSLCFAFCPQTYNFYKEGYDILPNYVKDIKLSINSSKNNSVRYVFIGRNESDIFYAKYIQDTNNTIILQIDFKYTPLNYDHEHRLFKIVKSDIIYKIIYNNFRDLIKRTNFDLIISKIIFYYPYDREDKTIFHPILFKKNIIITGKRIISNPKFKQILD